MEKHRIPVNDLHGIIVDAGVAGAISRDGVHMTGNGNLLLAGAVTRAILEACRR